MNLFIIDFDDSFTFNIASELYLLGLTPKVVHWSKWKNIVALAEQATDPFVIILGPGPGHPDEYSLLKDDLLRLQTFEHIFLLGICLGHQLIAYSMGMKILSSVRPMHGQAIELELPNWSVFQGISRRVSVQRYNSLACFGRDMPTDWKHVTDENDEVLVMTKDRFLSYQFHPESIGTSFREIFFKPIKLFLV